MDCTLCGLQTTSTILDGEKNFCCFGCRTVWHLLTAKGLVENWKDHPIFEQAIKSGLISNPELLIQEREKQSEKAECKRLTFEIQEMWCPSCAEVIEYLVKLEKGTYVCRVDYATDLASIEYNPCEISEDEIFMLIKSLGYRPVSLEGILGKPVSNSLYLRFFVASFAALNVMMLSYPLYASYFDYETEIWGEILAYLSLILSIPVITYSAWPIWKRFINSLRSGLYGMESLIVIGVLSSFILSCLHLWQENTEVYFDTLTVIITFVLLGKIIETKAKYTAKESFYSLARSLPQRGRKDGVFVSLKELASGDILEVVAGEKIVLDGVVEEGVALINEASMTGETLSILKQKGDKVLSGTHLETGRLFFRVEGGSSALEQIVDACRLNLENKSQYIRALDPWIRKFVPFVLVLALLVVLAGGSYETALSVLLISCPCAIGIAAPLVESRLMHILAQNGAIIRNRGALALLPKVSLFAFDKTGTITKGVFNIKGLSSLSVKDLQDLKGVAQLSRHPLSCALVNNISGSSTKFEDVVETEGQGVLADDGYRLGSRKFMMLAGVDVSRFSMEDQTEVFFWNKKEVHQIQFEDEILSDVLDLVQTLPNTWLLSGDRETVVKKVASKAGFKYWMSELSPLEKKNKIAEFKKSGEIVVFTGDGLNDAPALSEADIGIAVSKSQGLSQAAADILLTHASLKILPQLVTAAKEGQKLIRQNLFWAFIYNLIGIPLALFSLMNPILAAIAMTLSSLIVILNTYRLKTLKQK